MKKFKNILFHFWFWLLPPKKRFFFDTTSPKILIVSKTGLGDTLWATGIIHSIKETYPQGSIFLLTTELGREVFENNPDITNIFSFKKNCLWSYFSLKKALKAEKIQAVLVFHASQRLVLPLCARLGSSEIIGSENQQKGLDFLLTKAVKTPSKPLTSSNSSNSSNSTDQLKAINAPSCHEIERRMFLAKELGVVNFSKEILFFFSEEEQSRKIFPHKKPLIVLHPGAKDFYKCWPLENFIKLANRLKQTLDCEILLTFGNTKEQELVQNLQKKIFGAKILSSSPSLRSFAKLLSQADLVITNDTGPMHLAISVKTKVLALFGPTDPKICGPYFPTSSVEILSYPKCCNPCLKRSCLDPFCLKQISVEEAFTSSLKLLNISLQKEKPKTIAIIVLNWNGKKDTLECLHSLESLSYPHHEIIVVDNGSTDDSVETIKEAGGNNIGIAYALEKQFTYIFLLNNDTIVERHLLDHFLAVAEKKTQGGIFGSKILQYYSPKMIDHLGGYWNGQKAEFFSFHNQEEDRRDLLEKKVDYVCGCSFFVRAEVFREIGFLESKFFLLWEEADFCFRSQRAGYEIWTAPKAEVFHKISSSFIGGAPHSHYFWWRNRLLWIERNLSKKERFFLYKNLLLQEIFHLYKLKLFKSLEFSLLSFFIKVKNFSKKKRPKESLNETSAILNNVFLEKLSKKRKKLLRYQAGCKGILDYVFRRFGNCPSWIVKKNSSSKSEK
jgi:hypothetical protein